jgi:hypothetical protein
MFFLAISRYSLQSSVFLKKTRTLFSVREYCFGTTNDFAFNPSSRHRRISLIVEQLLILHWSE